MEVLARTLFTKLAAAPAPWVQQAAFARNQVDSAIKTPRPAQSPTPAPRNTWEDAPTKPFIPFGSDQTPGSVDSLVPRPIFRSYGPTQGSYRPISGHASDSNNYTPNPGNAPLARLPWQGAKSGVNQSTGRPWVYNPQTGGVSAPGLKVWQPYKGSREFFGLDRQTSQPVQTGAPLSQVGKPGGPGDPMQAAQRAASGAPKRRGHMWAYNHGIPGQIGYDAGRVASPYAPQFRQA